MTRKQPGFWDLVQADQVRYFGPNPPQKQPRDPLVGLLGADNASESVATPTGSGDAPSDNPLEAPTSSAPRDGFQPDRTVVSTPGIAGPMNDSPLLANDAPVLGGLSSAPLDLPPLGDLASGDEPAVGNIDSTNVSSPPVAPRTARTDALAAMSAAAKQSLAVGRAIASASKDILPLLPAIGSPPPADAAPQSQQAAGAREAGPQTPSIGSGADSGDSADGSSTARDAGQAPAITINAGPDHRLAKSVLESMSQKMERLVFNYARHEVERGFHMYQANLRALYRRIPS